MSITILGKNYEIETTFKLDLSHNHLSSLPAEISELVNLQELHLYENQLKQIYSSQEIIFIYAWNEWGEGMYLQGDAKYKNQKLEIVKKVVIAK